MRIAADDPSRLFEIKCENSFFNANAAGRNVIAVHTFGLPAWLTLEPFFRAAPTGRSLAKGAVPRSDEKLLVIADGQEGSSLDSSAANVLFIGDPAATLISRFFFEANSQVGGNNARFGSGPFKDRWTFILRRLESFLAMQRDCNYLTSRLAAVHGSGSKKPALDDAYERACAAIRDDFMFIGFAERLADSIFAMFDLFGWKQAPGFYAVDNIVAAGFAPHLDEIPIRLRRRLEQATAMDQRLYDAARESFEQRFDEADFSTDSLIEYRSQPAFASVDEFRLDYGNLEREARRFKDAFTQYSASMDGIVALLNSRIEQSQSAYEGLLRQHLIATGVLNTTDES